jgi:SAM-dependent methyltransferase
MFFGLLVPAAVLTYYAVNLPTAIMLTGIALGSVFAALRLDWIGTFFSKMRKLTLIKKRCGSLHATQRDTSYRFTTILQISLLFLSSWFFYFVAWALFKETLYGFEDIAMIFLCATYSIAWAVGFLFAITPAGLGVREAAFVLLSAHFAPAPVLASLSVFVRLWLMTIDTILFLIFLPLNPGLYNRKRQHQEGPPAFDSDGLNILDPSDRRGKKTRYITLLQEMALTRHLPSRHGGGFAMDLGCGYGRLSPVLARKGWGVVGIDPSLRLIEYAHDQYGEAEYVVAALPDLPVRQRSFDLIMMHNLLRPLLLLSKLDCVRGIGRVLTDEGKLIVVDNIRVGHQAFMTEQQIVDLFAAEGLRLVKRIPIRAGRWWLIYLIRYGIVPERWFEAIAEYELGKRVKSIGTPRWQYLNVLFIFAKVSSRQETRQR